MTLDSILVCATSEYELKRLLKEGGEVWQHVGRRGAGKLQWQHTLVKLPITVALRLGLVAAGPKLKDVPTPPVEAPPVQPAPRASRARPQQLTLAEPPTAPVKTETATKKTNKPAAPAVRPEVAAPPRQRLTKRAVAS